MQGERPIAEGLSGRPPCPKRTGGNPPQAGIALPTRNSSESYLLDMRKAGRPASDNVHYENVLTKFLTSETVVVAS